MVRSHSALWNKIWPYIVTLEILLHRFTAGKKLRINLYINGGCAANCIVRIYIYITHMIIYVLAPYIYMFVWGWVVNQWLTDTHNHEHFGTTAPAKIRRRMRVQNWRPLQMRQVDWIWHAGHVPFYFWGGSQLDSTAAIKSKHQVYTSRLYMYI